MKFLVVEDDFGSRRLLQALLKDHGSCDVVVDGDEAVEAFRLAWEDNQPYRAIFLDIMMPRVDGHQALRRIRTLEREFGVADKDQVDVIMTSALEDPKNVVEAYYKGGATSYMVKPIRREALEAELRRLGYQ
ncbi:MAG: response regulator [Spirochaetaceae bacterium]|nr:MAG: response regulator [Spirochaetaceae bacterium]